MLGCGLDKYKPFFRSVCFPVVYGGTLGTKTCVSRDECQQLKKVAAGSTSNGRMCVDSPLRCRKGKVVSPERRGAACSCGSDENKDDRKNCGDCTWGADGTTMCTACTNHLYLQQGTCVAAAERKISGGGGDVWGLHFWSLFQKFRTGNLRFS